MKNRSENANARRMERLKSAVYNGRASHAYIFEAEDAESGLVYAKDFAELLLGASGAYSEAERRALRKRIDEGNHPDFFLVEREREQLRVEEIRALQLELMNAAFETDRKIAVIKEADRMNRSAQNKLLKTLEEPNAGCVLILLSENAEKLLPTIRSRCVVIRFDAEGEDDAAFAKAKKDAKKIIEATEENADFFELKNLLKNALKTDKDKKQSEQAVLLLEAMEEIYFSFAEEDALRGEKTPRKTDVYRAIELTEEAKRRLTLENIAYNVSYVMRGLLMEIGG